MTADVNPPPIVLHPPIRKGETFVGNTNGKVIPEHLKSVLGIRLARPAYCLDGEIAEGMSAIFVRGIGTYNSIQEARLSRIRKGLPL